MESTHKESVAWLSDVVDMVSDDISFTIQPWGEVKIEQEPFDKPIFRPSSLMAILPLRPLVDHLFRSKISLTQDEYRVFLSLRKNYTCFFEIDSLDWENPFAEILSIVKGIRGSAMFVHKCDCDVDWCRAL